MSKVTLQDCQTYGGWLYANTVTSTTALAITNSAFERFLFNLQTTGDGMAVTLRNNLFHLSNLNLQPGSANRWEWRDTVIVEKLLI